MPKLDMNVASRPFRNVWPLLVFFGLLAVLSLAATVFNGVLLGSHWLKSRSVQSELRQRITRVDELEQETKAIETRLLKLNRDRLRRNTFFTNELIERRTFSWSLLLTRLEKILPDDVVMTAITPKISGDLITIRLECIAKSQEVGLELIDNLEQSPAFYEVFPETEGQEEILTYGRGLRYTLVTSYHVTQEEGDHGEVPSPQASF